MLYDIQSESVSSGLESFVEEFYHDRVEELAQMRKGLSNSDYKAIGDIAHRWKSFCAPYGFNYLEKASHELEKTLQSKKYDDLSLIFDNIECYLGDKKHAI